MRITVTALGLLLILTTSSPAREGPRSILENGSFELVVPAGAIKDGGQGAWKAGANGKVPAGWTLNTGYPGTMTVVEGEAGNGERCVRVTSGTKRNAQFYRPVSAIRPGRWYRISALVRGGAASILVYEYRTGGKVKPHTVASGRGPRNEWKRITGFFAPVAADFASASVALLVPRGTSALLDDVKVEAMESGPTRRSARPVTIGNKEVELTISAMGRLSSLVLKSSGKNYADPEAPTPVLSAWRGGVRIPVGSLTMKSKTLTARFADGVTVVRFKVTTKDRYVLFEITDARPDDLESVELRFPVKSLRIRDTWMPGTYDDEFGICHMGVTPNTETRLARVGAAVAPEARWVRRHGIEGGRSALVATRAGRFLSSIRKMERTTGLPSPMLTSGAPGETSSKDWARISPIVKQSYLFVTYLGPKDLDVMIEYAKLGGFGLIMLHRATWRASAGHETIARKAFPEGLPDLVAACEKIHAAGLRVGLHLYGPAISLNDAYVTPKPDPRLFTIEVAPLAATIDQNATGIPLTRTPDLPPLSSAGVYPGNLLRIGDEIVRWRELVPGSPARLVGCERGALGTKAASHRKGVEVRSLVLSSGLALVDPDSTLPEEMGKNLGRVVNATGADLVYFDGCGIAPPGKQPDRWYYVNRVLLASCAEFDHGVLVQTSLGPGRQLPWHLVPRSASADGHGDLKGYLDQRLAGILQMRKAHTAADIGWYSLDLHGRPDELEYVCAKALGADASVSVQAFKPLLEKHPRAREVFEMIARWERRRLSEDVPQELRNRLMAKGKDFKLMTEGEEWSLLQAEYEPDRPIAAFDGRANRIEIENRRKEPARLALEIHREKMATTPEAHAGPGSIPIIDLTDLAGFGDPGDPRMIKHAQYGGRSINADGLSLRAVKTSLESSSERPGAAVYAIDNATNGAGWGLTGRKLGTPLDLRNARALGLWVKGDGHGETLGILLCDREDKRARFNVALDYEGWRFKSFPLKGSIDWSAIEYVLFELNHIPPNTKVTVSVAEVRAVPNRYEPVPLRGLSITLGKRTITLPVDLAPGKYLTIDALGRGTHWPGGMREGESFELKGGALILPPGSHRLEISAESTAGYAGDLFLRICRTWPLRR